MHLGTDISPNVISTALTFLSITTVEDVCLQQRKTYWCRKSRGGRCQRGRNHSGRDKYWLLVHWCDCAMGREYRIDQCLSTTVSCSQGGQLSDQTLYSDSLFSSVH